VVAIAVLGLVGCGETVIDSGKTEDAIKHNLEKSVGLQISSVDCPSDVEVTPGTKFECTVVQKGGKTETATLKILNEDADVSLLDLSPSK
jgi:hypothetical protein